MVVVPGALGATAGTAPRSSRRWTGHYSRVAPERRPSSQSRPPRRRPPRGRRRVNPLLIGLVALVVIIAAIGLATRGGDAPTSRATADPVIPAVTTPSASADQLGPLDQELVSIGEKGVSIHSAGGRRKVVALTFDDGPGKDTPSVLSILKQNNVPATFFVVGREIQANPQMLGQEIAHGKPGHQLSDGLAAAGDHHRLAALHRVEQARKLGLGFRHRDLPHAVGHLDDQL